MKLRGYLGRVAITGLIAVAHQHDQNVTLYSLQVGDDLLEREADRGAATWRWIDAIDAGNQPGAIERPGRRDQFDVLTILAAPMAVCAQCDVRGIRQFLNQAGQRFMGDINFAPTVNFGEHTSR